jgi:lambda family phage portal protein
MWPFTRKKHKPIEVNAKFDLAQTTADNRKHWAAADGLSARAAMSAAVRRVVRIRSRYEAENNSWYAGILRTAVNHIVGNGPRLQLLTASPEANARIEKAWRQWATKIDLADMLRTICEAYWRDGEVFVMRADRPQNWPLTLDIRTIEADQVANPWASSVYNDPFIDDGIRFDRSTNELEVYVYNHHPGGNVPLSTMDGNWYSSKEVLHLFRADRPGQTRGIPRATPALQTLPIMRRQELATLYSAETAANFAMYLKSNSPSLDPSSSPADFAEIELTRNMLTTLPAGWEIGQVEPKQPGPLYEMFQRQALQSFSRCTNMPYTLAAGTGKDANFSSFKGDMKNVWEPEVQCEQSRIEWSIIEPVFRWFLESAIYVPGLLDGLPSINQIDHRWHWPPLPELDAVDSANAAAIRLSTGQSTLTQEHARRGQDWATEVARAADDFGIDVLTYKRALFAKTFDSASSAPTSTTLTTGTTAVADTAMNGAQVTSIVEIISQVAGRVIPPISAKALIRSAFPAIPEANVDAMLSPFAALPSTVQPGIAADGMPQGEYTQLGQRAFSNNQKRIMQTLQKLVDGAVTQVMAEQTLASIGLAPDRIAALIADALDGGIEPSVIQEVAA